MAIVNNATPNILFFCLYMTISDSYNFFMSKIVYYISEQSHT